MGDKGTTSGRIAGALVKNGLVIGISSRGMGSLKQMGEVMEVQDDFELLTWDLVSNPSNPDLGLRPKTSICLGSDCLFRLKLTMGLIKNKFNCFLAKILFTF